MSATLADTSMWSPPGYNVMAFWSTEKLKERLVAESLFEPYESSNVKNGAYELGLGSEAFITSDGTQKTDLNEGKQLTIPPNDYS
jgi:hypothetical protein